MYFGLLFTFLLHFLTANCKNVDNERQGRWFKTYTSIAVETNLVTSYIPSSCVQVDPSLPPCRNVRYLKFPSFMAKPNPPIYDTITEGKTVHTTELGWGEYLGIYAPTVTATYTKMLTTTVEDPRIVVTFAVKGCRPLRLPMDLNRCEVEQPSTVNIQEIIPTSTIATNILPTANFDEVGSIQDIIQNNNNLDLNQNGFDLVPASSENNFEDLTQVQPTAALPSSTV